MSVKFGADAPIKSYGGYQSYQKTTKNKNENKQEQRLKHNIKKRQQIVSFLSFIREETEKTMLDLLVLQI